MKRKNLPPHLPYDKSLVDRARELRNNATPAEFFLALLEENGILSGNLIQSAKTNWSLYCVFLLSSVAIGFRD